jgi:Domain of unknown function (DUF1704)
LRPARRSFAGGTSRKRTQNVLSSAAGGRAPWRGWELGVYLRRVIAGSDATLLEESARALLAAAERVELVARVAPVDLGADLARLARAYQRGKALVITRTGDRGGDLTSVRRALERLHAVCAPLGPFGALHAERALELELEARLVEALGTPDFRALAARRFPPPGAACARECDAFVAEALAQGSQAPVSLHRSDDTSDPRSLLSRLRTRARELGLKLRFATSRDQLATAATGDGVVSVRAGVQLTAAAAERIALHELLGHALPRARARHAAWTLFRVGTRGASDDEEGRALLVEARAGLLDAERRRELAFRHVAALGVRRGDEPRDTCATLLELGAPLERALDLTLRIQRGGGLAREIVYLPAYFAVRRAFSEMPALERWFERGRVGLEAAVTLTRAPPALARDPKASASVEG